MPPAIFWVQLGYLLALIAIFLLFETWSAFRDWPPDKLGPLPFEVPFFGALGGCVISFAGIFKYNRRWDPSYDYWHYVRPLMGAVIGSVGALTFLVLADLADKKGVTPNATIFDIVAFLLGYREGTFRELLQRFTDVIIKPSTEPGDGGGEGGPTPAQASQPPSPSP
jgi:hypothetical protein